ncbi:unnamed protein product [Arabidopsis thaliana]|uniref:Uncharacterized protein n=1 Tax=Arabidopsis thaliana TaxID=3702 RepID=A0A5S9XHE0_ARATH|nr:unnamed protein product [Arabidopsis thaliana]
MSLSLESVKIQTKRLLTVGVGFGLVGTEPTKQTPRTSRKHLSGIFGSGVVPRRVLRADDKYLGNRIKESSRARFENTSETMQVIFRPEFSSASGTSRYHPEANLVNASGKRSNSHETSRSTTNRQEVPGSEENSHLRPKHLNPKGKI